MQLERNEFGFMPDRCIFFRPDCYLHPPSSTTLPKYKKTHPTTMGCVLKSHLTTLGFAKDIVRNGINIALCTGFDNWSEILFKLLDVIGQSIKQTFCMYRIHDDTGTHLCIGCSGQYLGKVKDYLGRTMRDDGQITICAFGYIRGHIYLEIIPIVVSIVVHGCSLNWFTCWLPPSRRCCPQSDCHTHAVLYRRG